jgi:excisionase family DNA binding protein
MRTELEAHDIEAIVSRLLESLKPYLAGIGRDQPEGSIMDMDELCNYLKVTPKWVYERTHLNEIPHYKLSNKQLRFKRRDIDKWLESLKTPALHALSSKMKLLK